MGIKRHTPRSLHVACTDAELEYRKKTFPNFESIGDIKHKICCTACGINLSKEINGGSMGIHPSLEVILCKTCLLFYGDGLYKTDKSGDDVYCRWCAQGGTIYCCSKCSVAFCKKCTDRNLKDNKKVMVNIKKDNWECFICDSQPLWYQRAFAWAVQKYKNELDDGSSKRKLSVSSADSGTSKAGSVKRTTAGPASKKAKLESHAGKRPGPASRTSTKRDRVVKKNFLPDVSDEEDFNELDEPEDKGTPLGTEYTDPMETMVTQAFDFCFKLSNNLNTKLMRYSLNYKGNLDTSNKINMAVMNLHMDIKKVVRLYNAMDEKMMAQLDEFNEAQQELEKHKLAVEGPLDVDLNLEEYGITDTNVGTGYSNTIAHDVTEVAKNTSTLLTNGEAAEQNGADNAHDSSMKSMEFIADTNGHAVPV